MSTQPELFPPPSGWRVCACGCGRSFEPKHDGHLHFEPKCRLQTWAVRQVAHTAALAPLSAPFVPWSLESRESAQNFSLSRAERDRRNIVAYVTQCGPVLDEEIQAACGIHPNAVRARLGEVRKAGLIEVASEKRRTRSGMKARCWRRVP